MHSISYHIKNAYINVYSIIWVHTLCLNAPFYDHWEEQIRSTGAVFMTTSLNHCHFPRSYHVEVTPLFCLHYRRRRKRTNWRKRKCFCVLLQQFRNLGNNVATFRCAEFVILIRFLDLFCKLGQTKQSVRPTKTCLKKRCFFRKYSWNIWLKWKILLSCKILSVSTY